MILHINLPSIGFPDSQTWRERAKREEWARNPAKLQTTALIMRPHRLDCASEFSFSSSSLLLFHFRPLLFHLSQTQAQILHTYRSQCLNPSSTHVVTALFGFFFFFFYFKKTFVLGFWRIGGGLIHEFVGFDSDWLGVANRWLWWFMGFDGGGLWVLVYGFWYWFWD